MAINGSAHSLWADMVASRFELLLFAVSLIGYMIVFASRRSHKQKGAKDLDCKADFSVEEVSQVDVEETEGHDVDSEEVSADVQSTIAELLDNKQFEKACDIFEMNYSALFDMDIDEDMDRRLLMAALKCGRQSLAEHLLQTSQTDFAKHVGTIQNWWRRSSVKAGMARVVHMHDVLDRMAQMFNELHPFEEEDHSDDESTCVLGDEISNDGSVGDSDWDDSDLWP